MKIDFKKLVSIFILTLVVSFVYAKPKEKALYISLDPAVLKEKASALSAKVGELSYGDSVILLDEKKNWSYVCSVDDDSVQGWIPSSALSKKKIVAGATKTTADADEIALAGKGFNSTIEAVYADEFEIDYTDVDFVEAQLADIDDVVAFIEDGRLFVGGSEDDE